MFPFCGFQGVFAGLFSPRPALPLHLEAFGKPLPSSEMDLFLFFPPRLGLDMRLFLFGETYPQMLVAGVSFKRRGFRYPY